MGAIVAALSKCDDDVVHLVITMLEALIHRGANSHEVITPNSAVSAPSLGELRKKSNSSSIVSIGRNVSNTRWRSESFRSKKDGYAAVSEGEFFPQYLAHPFNKIGISRRCLLQRTAKGLLRDFDGCFTFAVASSRQILAGRDKLGLMPLYYGENEKLCAIASERKALWKIGITEVCSFPPGNLAVVSPAGFAFKHVSTIKQPPQRKMKIDEAARRLQRLLEESTRERLLDVEKVGVAFSGGLDSSVIARLAQRCGISVNLISVGLEGQPELVHAKEAAKALCLPIIVQTFKMADVEKALSKALWLIEEPSVMKVCVAIPLFWTAKVASKLGYCVLLAGQGADELFGGYHRYLTLYARCGIEKVAEAIYSDTITSYERNFQRDEPVSTFHKVGLRLPFVDTSVVDFALSLPVDLKVESEGDDLRKRVLRQVARNLGISASIADKPKKSIQFATGVDRALRDLAKGKGLTPREYVEELLGTIYPGLRVQESEHSRLLQPKIS